MEHSACFIGHRIINDTPELRKRLRSILSELIEGGTTAFIFGDHSEFDSLCYDLVTELKVKNPAIKRINFRKDYENTDDYTMRFLIAGYEESICPKGVGDAGKASYIERNRAMILESDICVFYYDKNYRPAPKNAGEHRPYPQSGTAAAFHFAEQKKKKIINCI